jgi:hypothetical protein
MSSGDVVKVSARDSFSKAFNYASVYAPPARQGKVVIAWYADGTYDPAWGDGIMLVCMAQTTNSEGKYVFGNWDMHESFPQDRWYYYNDNGTPYPSSNGYTVKYISKIEIFTDNVPDDGEVPDTAEVIEVTAYVDLPSIGIRLDKSEINYGTVRPGESSDIVPVTITTPEM